MRIAAAPPNNGGGLEVRSVIPGGSWDQHLGETGQQVPSDGDTRMVVQPNYVQRCFDMSDGSVQCWLVPAPPWSALCRLKLHYGGVIKLGTGSFIGPRTILTAAHNLHDDGRDVDSITVVPGQASEGDEPFDKETTSAFAYNANFRTASEDEAAQFDYGVIFLKDDRLGRLVSWSFPFLSVADGDWTSKNLGWINVAGYPDGFGGHILYGKGKPTSIDGNVILHDTDTSRGDSGGPIYWFNAPSDYRILGVHTDYIEARRLNSGVRITGRIDGHLRHWVDQPGKDQGATRLP
jgi:V8-like Glu-specific endopeptidase